MSRYKIGDKVKCKEMDVSDATSIFTVCKYEKRHGMITYILENSKGERHDCYFPNYLQIVKRRINK